MFSAAQADPSASPRGFWRWVIVALLVHGAVVAVSHGIGARARRREAASQPQAVIEYTIEENSSTPERAPLVDDTQAAPPRTAADVRAEPGTRLAAVAGRSGATSESPSPSTATSAEPANVAAAPDGQGAWSMPLTNAPPNIGLNRSAFENGLVAATPEALGAPASSAKVRSILRQGLTEHDLSIGMARGGVVIGAAHDAVSRSLVPDESFALVEVRFDNTGHAVSARVVDSLNDRTSWNEAAQALVGQLENRAVRLPEHASGLSVFVRIDVSLRLPSGAKGAVTLSGPGLAGDLSDIGAKKTRNVAARIVSETIL